MEEFDVNEKPSKRGMVCETSFVAFRQGKRYKILKVLLYHKLES